MSTTVDSELVWDTIVRRLTLWDARSVQNAFPDLIPLIHGIVAKMADDAVNVPAPEMLDALLNIRPCFQERTCGEFVLLRTPLDATVYCTVDTVSLVMRLYSKRRRGTVELRVTRPDVRPTFDTLRRVFERVHWFSTTLRGRVDKVEFRTLATVHHPPTEVLNLLVTRFVQLGQGTGSKAL